MTSLGDVTEVCRFLSKKNHLDLEGRQADFRVTKNNANIDNSNIDTKLEDDQTVDAVEMRKKKTMRRPGKDVVERS